MKRVLPLALGVLAFWSGVTVFSQARAATAFTMDLTATGDLEADYLAFGMVAGANDVYDAGVDDPAPPPAPSGNDIYFAVNGVITRLAVDMREVADNKVWELRVVIGADQSVTLTWNPAQAPAGAQLVLKNKQTGTTVKNMMVDTNVVVDQTTTYLIVLGPANAPPVAVDDTYYILGGETPAFTVLANDYDAAGQGLALDSLTQPPAGQGTATQNGNQINYDPQGFIGTTTFTYTIEDNDGIAPLTDTATVTVHVNADVVGKRTHEEQAQPGDPFTVTYEIRHAGTLASLKLTEVLPLEDKLPPDEDWWWDYVDGSLTMQGGAAAPAVITEANRELVLDWGANVPASPVQFTITLTVPAEDVNPKTFLGRIDYQLVADGPVLSEDMPDTVVMISRGSFDVDANGILNLNDLIYIFRWKILGSTKGKLNLLIPAGFSPPIAAAEIAANIDTLGDNADVDGNGILNLNDLIYVFRWKILGSTKGKLNLLIPAGFTPPLTAAQIAANIDPYCP